MKYIDIKKLHEILNSNVIRNSFEIYLGTQTSAVSDRFQNHVMPFFGMYIGVEMDDEYYRHASSRLQRVHQRYSEDELPLDPDSAAVLLNWKRECEGQARKDLVDGKTPLLGLDLVFSSPATGRHFHMASVPVGLYPACRMLSGGLPEVLCPDRRLVSAG